MANHKHADICAELTALYERKNHDYGDSFHESYIKWGMLMVLIRLEDKFKRLETLTKNRDSQRVMDESFRDTLKDLANYAIMALMEMPDGDPAQK